MNSKEVPENPVEFAELFFGKGDKRPKGKTAISYWLRRVRHPAAKSGYTVTLKRSGYTGTEPNTWHLTKWSGAYFLIYISDDLRLYVLNLNPDEYYMEGNLSRNFHTWDNDVEVFNYGKGWAYDVGYEVELPIPEKFTLLNWNTNPFEEKE